MEEKAAKKKSEQNMNMNGSSLFQEETQKSLMEIAAEEIKIEKEKEKVQEKEK